MFFAMDYCAEYVTIQATKLFYNFLYFIEPFSSVCFNGVSSNSLTLVIYIYSLKHLFTPL